MQEFTPLVELLDGKVLGLVKSTQHLDHHHLGVKFPRAAEAVVLGPPMSRDELEALRIALS